MILLIITIAAILFFSFQSHEWEVRCNSLSEQLDAAKMNETRLQARVGQLSAELEALKKEA